MKTSIFRKYFLAGMVLMGFAFLFFSCEKENVNPPTSVQSGAIDKRPEVLSTNTIVHLSGLVEDAAMNQNPNIAENAVLYNSVDHSPLLNPNGTPVTYGNFMRVSGTANVKCVTSGSSITVTMNNLIPKGIYTLWIQTFNAPGFDGTMNNLSGYGAVNGHNNFRASAGGSGQLSVTLPAGLLSMQGSVGDCLVSSDMDFHIIGVYQSTGQTFGWTPGREGLFVEHFRFMFRK
jgi:hypothetical protein